MNYATMQEVRKEALRRMDDGSVSAAYEMLLGALADYLLSSDETTTDAEILHFQSCVNRLTQ